MSWASSSSVVYLGLASFAALLSGAEETGSPKLHVDSHRLQGSLERLSEFGRNPEGGVTRIGFSETDLAAREYVSSLMKNAGLEVRVDPAGNLFGLRAGSERLPKLLFGSHIDSVLHGGNFDGDVGSMGAIEVIRALNDHNVKTRHPLVGVVQGIVGLKRWKCVATGFANHAGTTPMNRRRDALAAASKDPGFEVDLTVESDVRTLTLVWLGDLPIGEALRNRSIRLEGPRPLREGFPRWLALTPFAATPLHERSVRPPLQSAAAAGSQFSAGR
jgi:hypothetical protein